MPDLGADYVIVGAGSAGCVVADRLSEDGAQVVLLEAGPSDWHPMIHIPAGALHLRANPLVNWNYYAEPEPQTGNRSLHWPRGRVLGGTSSINGMLYVRGNPADYDGWAQMGCRGWSYADVLPYFKKSERYASGDAQYRGKSGPLLVEDYRTILPLTHRFVEGAQEAGFPLTRDYNGAVQEGVGYSQMTRNGRFRGSTARTFLAEARRRPNLRVVTKAIATRLLLNRGRCIGVVFRQAGQDNRVLAAREVIVSGGTVNSPHLLQVSGIGPGVHLQSIGVTVTHDLPGVGANLSDHFAARITHRVKDEVSINQMARGLKLVGEIGRYATTGRGALTFGVTTAMVFCRIREGLESAAETMPGADIQSDEALTGFLSEAGTNLRHPVGTCRMGEDPMAVVDPRLRVRGLEGLRVIDASVMPTVTTGNTNASSIMIGEMGAAMIREDAAGFTAAGAAPYQSAA